MLKRWCSRMNIKIASMKEKHTASKVSCFRAAWSRSFGNRKLLPEAIAIARKQKAKSCELRAAVSLARFLRDTNRRDEAHALLAEIYGWFTEGFDTADLKDAKTLLDQLA